jgi:hypothetical protein
VPVAERPAAPAPVVVAGAPQVLQHRLQAGLVGVAVAAEGRGRQRGVTGQDRARRDDPDRALRGDGSEHPLGGAADGLVGAGDPELAQDEQRGQRADGSLHAQVSLRRGPVVVAVAVPRGQEQLEVGGTGDAALVVGHDRRETGGS